MVTIKGVGYCQVTGSIRLECVACQLVVNVDVAAALAIALHLGMPIYIDRLAMLREDQLDPVAATPDHRGSMPIPEAFREVIENLDLPAPAEGEEREEREL